MKLFGGIFRFALLALSILQLHAAPEEQEQEQQQEQQQYLRSSQRELQGGMGGGGMGGGGMGGGGGGWRVMDTVHNLLDSAEQNLITRSWTTLANGTVVTTTTSTDADTAERLVEHVLEMKALAERGGWVRRWDPLFRQIFAHSDEIDLTVQDISNGVKVWLSGQTECGDDLVQKHIRVVDDFVARGYTAAHEEHAASNKCN